MRRITSGYRAARSPSTKNVARAPCAPRTSRIRGVNTGSGPSSNVSATMRSPVASRLTTDTKNRLRGCAIANVKNPIRMIAIAQMASAAHPGGRIHAAARPAARAQSFAANALSTGDLVRSYRRDHEAGVDAAERELVADHPRQLRGARLAHHVVERRAALVDDLEVTRRGDPAVAQHRDQERDLER